MEITNKDLKFSVIIPVYSGGTILAELARRISEVLVKYQYEILFICDSHDERSIETVNELMESDPLRIIVHKLSRNYGQHKALLYGFGKASGDFIVTMDEDLQHDPADILKLFEKQKDGDYDVVYGNFVNPHKNRIRRIISEIARRLLKFLISGLYEKYSPYRLIKSETALQIVNLLSPYVFIDDYLSRVTQKFAFLDLTLYEQLKEESSYTALRILKHGLLVILIYSGIVSLLLASGIVMLSLGMILNIKILLMTSLIILIAGLAGLLIKKFMKLKSSKPVLTQP